MRCIMIILDGLGDRGQDCFEGKTPLHAAYTPNLDHLSSLGMNGLYHSTLQGIPMSSETAHFVIFGYDISDFPGRGVIEAVGEGVNVAANDVVALCHLCSVEEKEKRLMLRYGCPEMPSEEAMVLMESIQSFNDQGIRFRIVHSKGIHGFLVMSGNVSKSITDSDPVYEGKDIMEVLPLNTRKVSLAAKKTAESLNEYLIWSFRTLSGHAINKERMAANLLPVNALVTQRAGKKKKLMSFRDAWGFRGLSISSGAIYWGICSALGIDTLRVKDTGNVEEDLKYRLSLARDAAEYDFIHVHTKMPDEAGHSKNPWYKRDVIEAIDRAMSMVVDDIIKDREVLLVITADHSTASSGTMIHTGETVPLTMVGKYVRKDKVGEFNEISCPRGGLGIVKGKELMYLILNFLDRGKLHGLMDTPVDQPYYPGRYKPLTL